MEESDDFETEDRRPVGADAVLHEGALLPLNPAQHACESIDPATNRYATLPGRVGEGRVLEDPDQAVASLHCCVDPSSG